MAQAINFKWPQGEDLSIRLAYKEGRKPARPVPVNLSTGYALRMDVVNPGTRATVYTFDSTAFPGTLSAGTDGAPNINIVLPRQVNLPGGAVYEYASNPETPNTLNYDIFLRNTVTNKQVKILKGSILVEESNTLWA